MDNAPISGDRKVLSANEKTEIKEFIRKRLLKTMTAENYLEIRSIVQLDLQKQAEDVSTRVTMKIEDQLKFVSDGALLEIVDCINQLRDRAKERLEEWKKQREKDAAARRRKSRTACSQSKAPRRSLCPPKRKKPNARTELLLSQNTPPVAHQPASADSSDSEPCWKNTAVQKRRRRIMSDSSSGASTPAASPTHTPEEEYQPASADLSDSEPCWKNTAVQKRRRQIASDSSSGASTPAASPTHTPEEEYQPASADLSDSEPCWKNTAVQKRRRRIVSDSSSGASTPAASPTYSPEEEHQQVVPVKKLKLSGVERMYGRLDKKLEETRAAEAKRTENAIKKLIASRAAMKAKEAKNAEPVELLTDETEGTSELIHGDASAYFIQLKEEMSMDSLSELFRGFGEAYFSEKS